MEVAQKLVLDEAVEWPSADISYTWESSARASLVIVLHFSRVVGGPAYDMKLDFGRPLAVSWEDECFNFISTPDQLPKCAGLEFHRWTYPTLVIEGSAWAARYAARLYSSEDFKAHDIRHYLLISMNDTLHVLSRQLPTGVRVPSLYDGA